MLVSPTYFGMTADLRAIAALCRARGVPLVVDEAWGGHLHFHPSLPDDALAAGADIVLHGTHKTIGSLTQSAMLHVGSGAGSALRDALDKAFGLLRSTSPNSLLLASLDAARSDAAVSGSARLEEALRAVALVRTGLRRLDLLDTVDERLVGRPGVAGFDGLRLTIDVRRTGLSGFEMSNRVHHTADINLEMVTPTVVVAHFGAFDDVIGAGLELTEALASSVADRPPAHAAPAYPELTPPAPGPVTVSPRAAYFASQESVPLHEAAGRVAAESVVVYPPGIANLLPGERVTAENVAFLAALRATGGIFRGCTDPTLTTLRVVREP